MPKSNPVNPVILSILILVMTGCTYHELPLSNTCSVSDPIKDLPWLVTMVRSMKQSPHQNWFIQQGTYDGETVFTINFCCTNCNNFTPTYTCSGDFIASKRHPLRPLLVDNLVTILEADDFECLEWGE